MFDSQAPTEKRSAVTMLLVIFSVMAALGLITWFVIR
jgi:hypothetical protein